jgi:N-acetylglucosamine-6-phosphate deacetylase
VVELLIFKNAKVFYNTKFHILDVEIKEDIITNIGENLLGKDCIDCKGKLLIPGFIDVHTHGREGMDFSTAEPEDIGKMCNSYVENGVTSILATTMTMEYENLKQIMDRNRRAIEANYPGCRILGINLEGPFLGPDRKGCHDEEFLIPLNTELFDELDGISGGNIRLLDLDPNLENSIDFIKKYSKTKVISLAHTSASYDIACEAVKAGATHVTHLFNAMNGLHHRDPGLIGMASDLPVNAELICDGIHIHPAVMRMIFKLIGERIVIISDSMSAAGLGEGEYELGGLKVFVKDRKASLMDGTIAGSTTNILEEVKNIIKFGIPEEKAILAATLNPARALKLDHEIGEIMVGKKADLLVLSIDYTLEQVYIGGKRFK